MIKRSGTILLLALSMAATVLAQDDYARETTERSEFALELEPNEHGGYFSVGVSLLGGGIAGFELKAQPINRLAIEGGVTYRPGLIATEDPYSGGGRNSNATVDWTHGAMLHLGPTFYFSKKFNRRDTKVIAHGVFLKGGYSFGTLSESMFALGWSRERYVRNRPGNSYTFQLGAGFTRLMASSIPLDSYGSLEGSVFSPMIFIKFKWDFYLVEYERQAYQHRE